MTVWDWHKRNHWAQVVFCRYGAIKHLWYGDLCVLDKVLLLVIPIQVVDKFNNPSINQLVWVWIFFFWRFCKQSLAVRDTFWVSVYVCSFMLCVCAWEPDLDFLAFFLFCSHQFKPCYLWTPSRSPWECHRTSPGLAGSPSSLKDCASSAILP
jgi:hypothetical protein